MLQSVVTFVSALVFAPNIWSKYSYLVQLIFCCDLSRLYVSLWIYIATVSFGIECDTLYQHCTNATQDSCIDTLTLLLNECNNDTCGCECYYAIETYIESTWNFTDNNNDYEGYCDGCDGNYSDPFCPTYDFLAEFCS